MTDTTKTPERAAHEFLGDALSAAQANFPPITKGKHAAAFGGYNYADLAQVFAAVRPALSAQGLAILQRFDLTDDGATILVTELRYRDQKDQSRVKLKIDGLDNQKAGIAVTYWRRYSVLAICGVHPEDEDTDAQAAREAPQARQGGYQAPAPRQQQSSGNGGPKPTTDGRGYSLRLAGEPDPLGPFATPRDACGKLYRLMAGSADADGMNAAEIRESMELNKAVIDAAGPEARQHMEALLQALEPKQGAAA